MNFQDPILRDIGLDMFSEFDTRAKVVGTIWLITTSVLSQWKLIGTELSTLIIRWYLFLADSWTYVLLRTFLVPIMLRV